MALALYALPACQEGGDAGSGSPTGTSRLGGAALDGGSSDAPTIDGDVLGQAELPGVDEGSCARCADNQSCLNGVCLPEGCPPPEPHGVEPGDNLTDLVVYDCEGEPVKVHALCGANVGFFNLFAGW